MTSLHPSSESEPMTSSLVEIEAHQASRSVRAAPRRTRPAQRYGVHFHTWVAAATEGDEFGVVRMDRCACGSTRYQSCA